MTPVTHDPRDAMTPVTHDPRDAMTWRQTRAWLNEHRWELAARAADLYPDAPRVAGTALLAKTEWLPSEPVPLKAIRLEWSERPAGWAVTGDEAAPFGVTAGFPRYSDAMRELTSPRVFHNRMCYALRGIGDSMVFGPAQYFANIDIGEAVAHEYARAVRSGETDLPLRRAIGDPLDLSRRPLPVAISTLVLRQDRDGPRMLLHWRDPAKVAMNGGLYQVAPVGVFQPSDDAEWNLRNDFDLWRSIQREMHEELLGGSEDYGSDTRPIDYAGWEFARKLDAAREIGDIAVDWLGAGIDPLTLVCDLLCRVTFASHAFDDVFEQDVFEQDVFEKVVGANDEGTLSAIPFTAETVRRYPIQPAGAALLRLAARSLSLSQCQTRPESPQEGH